jgi:methylthioribose-1-phosphate isomerase
MDDIEGAIAAIRDDKRSGSSALLARGVDLLERMVSDRAALEAAATALCRAQPAMAGFRTLAARVRKAHDAAAAIEEFSQQIARAPAAIARNTVSMLMLRDRRGPLRLVTCSASQTVEIAIRAAAGRSEVVVCCAEGRPQMEGRDLARRLAVAGQVEVFTDAAIGLALDPAEALIVGADAVGPDSFINKVGTAALCALAQWKRVPVYVLAGREKLLDADELGRLEPGGGEPAEVWPDAPAGALVRNPYFESVPLALVSAVVTDAAVINMSG